MLRKAMSVHASIRRVKTIFSVIASPSRLDVLKILNTKGPMTYSELKTLAGFKAKKESGKFAYHLRKLLRQSLIAQNRAERKYMLTTLGRLVLNSAKQIEEQALLESGRLFVRSSRHKMEEFTTDRITHSLVTEAGMPVELAQRVASEAESRIYKFQTAYLTAPLIRELVNSILIEEGLEEYRHRLSRLGMPVYDVTEEFEKVGQSQYGLESLVNRTANSVLSEYLLLIQLPRDVADSHLSGDIHISNAGYWSLKPDTLFVNLAAGDAKTLSFQGKFPYMPGPDFGKGTALKMMQTNYLLTREAGRDIYYAGFSETLAGAGTEDAKNILAGLTYSYLQSGDGPRMVLEVDGRSKATFDSITSAYLQYCRATPVPSICLAVVNSSSIGKSGFDALAEATLSNGVLVFNNDPETKRSVSGSSVENFSKAGPMVLDSVSVNMPRIALEAQNDDVYFRAKTTLQLENAVNALKMRRRLIESNFKGGLLPSLSMCDGMVYSESPYLRINMTGLREALSLVEPDASSEELLELQSETIQTADDHLSSIKDGEGMVFQVMLTVDESAERFPQLDKAKFGRAKMKGLSSDAYEQGVGLSSDSLGDRAKVASANTVLKEVKGGALVRLELPVGRGEPSGETLAKAASVLNFFVAVPELRVCRKCGAKNDTESSHCSRCGGPI